ncbi:hypothetical protein IG631_00121 [Alternaria alternata]|nr:hypothetical protein IG631_00121 [Alternaria alternata]
MPGCPPLEREGERAVREHGGLQATCIDQGPCRKMADEQGLIRGVSQSNVEAGNGAIIGQMRCGKSKEPAAREDRDATGLGNACTACCGVSLSMLLLVWIVCGRDGGVVVKVGLGAARLVYSMLP